MKTSHEVTGAFGWIEAMSYEKVARRLRPAVAAADAIIE